MLILPCRAIFTVLYGVLMAVDIYLLTKYAMVESNDTEEALSTAGAY
jgi:hypothetical protein